MSYEEVYVFEIIVPYIFLRKTFFFLFYLVNKLKMSWPENERKGPAELAVPQNLVSLLLQINHLLGL